MREKKELTNGQADSCAWLLVFPTWSTELTESQPKPQQFILAGGNAESLRSFQGSSRSQRANCLEGEEPRRGTGKPPRQSYSPRDSRGVQRIDKRTSGTYQRAQEQPQKCIHVCKEVKAIRWNSSFNKWHWDSWTCGHSPSFGTPSSQTESQAGE